MLDTSKDYYTANTALQPRSECCMPCWVLHVKDNGEDQKYGWLYTRWDETDQDSL